ncbi:MAG: DUF4249 family protein [Ignavibacterium sp.]|nr:MAG: DUF4249 family protein [Ignavibacterium sp.]
MKKIFLITTLFFPLIGCENEQVVNTSIAHEEFTVVQAELRPDERFPGVRFTKTLPLGTQYNIEQAELKNISAYLRIDSTQIIPLHYNSEGLYQSLYEFYIESGQVYELFAERDETFIYSKTYIPEIPIIVQSNYNQSGYYLEAEVRSFQDEVYSALWIISSSTVERAPDYFSVSVPQFITGNSTVGVRSSSLPEQYRSSIYDGSRLIQVFAFDKAFKPYFDSRTSSQGINDPFIQGGGSVEWNVQGDNVIGMFIGVAESIHVSVE